MRFSIQIAALSAVASIANALPTVSEKSFTLKQVTPKSSTLKPGPIALRDAYVKYKAEIPDHVSAAAAASSGTVVATPQSDDISYLIPVVVGGTTLNLDLDTGSSDL